MRKYLTRLLAASLLVLGICGLTACTEEKTYVAYSYGAPEGGILPTSVYMLDEYPYKMRLYSPSISEMYGKDVVEDIGSDKWARKPVTYAGQKYELSRYQIDMDGWTAKIIVTYRNADGIKMKVDYDTGKIVAFRVPDELVKVSDGLIKNRAVCLAIARAQLSNFVSDPEAYMLDSVLRLDWGYRFKFVRYIGDIQCYDWGYFEISFQGDLVNYEAVNLGDLEGVTLPSEEEMFRIQDAMDAKLRQMYESVSEDFELEWPPVLKKEEIVRLEDGRAALSHRYTIKATSKKTLQKGEGYPSLIVPFT